jgi:hypothetical protein
MGSVNSSDGLGGDGCLDFREPETLGRHCIYGQEDQREIKVGEKDCGGNCGE